MPVKRRLPKGRAHRITPAAIDAYIARDYTALHRELELRPWEASPLPLADCALGVDQGPAPHYRNLFAESWPQAQELQRALEAEAAAR